jgi:hypothetical protein
MLIVVAVLQQLVQLQDGLARQDDFGLGQGGFHVGAGKGQAVAVGGNQLSGCRRFASTGR